VARTDYQGFLDAGEGRISFDEFATRHLEIIDGAAHSDAFLTLIGAAITDRGRIQHSMSSARAVPSERIRPHPHTTGILGGQPDRPCRPYVPICVGRIEDC
jgi:hypothetical protein